MATNLTLDISMLRFTLIPAFSLAGRRRKSRAACRVETGRCKKRHPQSLFAPLRLRGNLRRELQRESCAFAELCRLNVRDAKAEEEI